MEGLLVLRSDDARHWTEQAGFKLGEPSHKASDRAIGQHIVIDSERAFILADLSYKLRAPWP